jgi:hypothetical protein
MVSSCQVGAILADARRPGKRWHHLVAFADGEDMDGRIYPRL